PLLAHLYRRYQARPHQSDDPQDYRARGGIEEDRLLAAPHGPLRAGGHLRQHAWWRWQRWDQGTAWRLHYGLRDIRYSRPRGDRPGTPEPALRLLVESAPRLHGVERVGAAAAIRERDRAGGSPLEQVWPSHSLLGSSRPAQCPDHRPWRQPPDGARSEARARSCSRVRFRGRGGRHHEPGRLNLDLVARWRQVPHGKDGDNPARASLQGPAAAPAARLWRSAAAGD